VKQLGMLLLGMLLASLAGACWYLLRVEWLKADLLLPLVVYLAVAPREQGPGLVVEVFLLGLVADNLGGTTPGMHALSYLVIWLLLSRWRSLLAFDSPPTRVLLVAGASLGCQLLHLLLILASAAGGNLYRVQLWALVPVAVLSGLLALPTWPLAAKAWPAREARP